MGITCLYDVLKAPVNDVTKRGLLASFDQVLSLSLLEKAVVPLDLEIFPELVFRWWTWNQWPHQGWPR